MRKKYDMIKEKKEGIYVTKPIYEILIETMNDKNMKIPDVARASGLSDSTVRSIITRKQSTVALEVAFKLSKGLNISLEKLNGMEVPSKKASPTWQEAEEALKTVLYQSFGHEPTEEELALVKNAIDGIKKV